MMENIETTMTEKSYSGVVVSEPAPSSVEPLNRRWMSDSNREKLREAWPIVKSLLEEVGISCSMDTVDSAVTVESLCSTERRINAQGKLSFPAFVQDYCSGTSGNRVGTPWQAT